MRAYKDILKLSKRSMKRRYFNRQRDRNRSNVARNNENNQYTDHDLLSSSQNLIENDYQHEEVPDTTQEETPINVAPPENNWSEDYRDINISNFLTLWALQFNIKSNALTALLKYLKRNDYPTLPSDSRTLMCTPMKNKIIEISGGMYAHIGIKDYLDKMLAKCEIIPNEILLDFNIDGVPISKSSQSCFWMILAKPYDFLFDEVFVVGVFHGYKKPNNFQDYLKEFVNELKSLMMEFKFDNKNVDIKIRSFICDAPARAAILGTKSHAAYFGCSKCCQEGLYIKNRMTFPETNARLRTDESFRNREDEHYHVSRSALEELPVDMVDQFPLEYLHPVCLGIVKKMIKLWISAKILPSRDTLHVSERLLSLSETQPTDFQRKCRPITDISYYKGSEFRTFVLYSGPFVLKDILTTEKYSHFLLLHVAIYILCGQSTALKYSSVAKDILITFIEEMAIIYGDEHIIYNVHNLLHIPDDVKIFGNLDNYSAFPFESFMSKIKEMLRKNNQPLAQICNRIYELRNAAFIKEKISKTSAPILKKGVNINGNVLYKNVTINDLHFNTNIKNQWMMTKDNKILRFVGAERINNEIYLNGHELKKKEDFYNVPIKSSLLGIYKADTKESQLNKWKITDINRKLFFMKLTENEAVFFPLLHQ